MYILSVNLGQPQPIRSKSGLTGIFKRPIAHLVQVNHLGLAGDAVIDTENHGGPDQAVYIYTAPDYAWWADFLGQALEPGTFGENLTISDLESAHLNAGDRLLIGDPARPTVILEATAPRIPCGTLAARMEDPHFVKKFKETERPGFYCRVIQPGTVQAGDPFAYQPYPGAVVLSMLEMFHEFYTPHLDEVTLRRHLAAPVAIRDRLDKEAKLRKLNG